MATCHTDAREEKSSLKHDFFSSASEDKYWSFPSGYSLWFLFRQSHIVSTAHSQKEYPAFLKKGSALRFKKIPEQKRWGGAAENSHLS